MIRRAESFEKLREQEEYVPKSELKRCIPNTESLLKVYCRMKPCNSQVSSQNFISRIGNTLLISQNNAKKSFSFSRVFDERATNQDLYDEIVHPMVEGLVHKGRVLQPSQVRTGVLFRGFRCRENILDRRPQRKWPLPARLQVHPEAEGGARGEEQAAEELVRPGDQFVCFEG